MLYNQRKRLKERADAEARGTSFWTTSFSEKVRMKLLYAVRDATKGDEGLLLEVARNLVLKDEGEPYLFGYGPDMTPAEDFWGHFMNCRDDVLPSAIEALYKAMQSFEVRGLGYVIPTLDFGEFERNVHQILEEERIAFDFVRGEMVSLKSKELHQGVIEPAMQLLHNARFSKAEKAYQDALEEVTKGKPGDAITDVGTALQETLTTLGCEGKSLGPLIKSAKAKGLLAAHDPRMTDAIENVMKWAAADRNVTGDSHKADSAAKEDAWLIIHVVGALIVRLVGATGR